VPERPHVLQLNLAYDPRLEDIDALLQRYTTLVEFSQALTRAGAEVTVVQRFFQDGERHHGGVTYRFVHDFLPARLDAWSVSAAVVGAVCEARADVVHINGLMFPAMAVAVRNALPDAVIVMQDHSGHVPRARWPFQHTRRTRWRDAFRQVDVVTFTSAELARPWHDIGLPHDAHVAEIVEASTTLRPIDRSQARADTGIEGAPALLWVGRLNRNKDPLTVIAALADVFDSHAGVRCSMVYSDAALEAEVRDAVHRSRALRGRVTLLGAVPHSSMASCYSAADVFISGSHHEGSGYALIEALACGLVPVVTDIPAFRVIAGPCGARWAPGDARACADALRTVLARDLQSARRQSRRHFSERLSWDIVAALTTYATLIRRRGSAAPS
jgi:glycosyltransferase involved in cell wall biosynthesis